ncbi:MAG: hypothetical protein IJ997_00845, partial [Mycoplasmataceae bacterium]|nr:hypothetical protein [Mycoplasmataceae bacterium]
DESLNDKINELEQKLNETEILLNEEIKRNELLNKKIILNDESLVLFKLKFNDFQLIGNDLINLLNKITDDKKVKLKAALRTVIESWNLYD